MRIQHNIAALNAHGKLMTNNNAVAKNLEKLSSGYRINRAGDDAAGLAISEKMRGQIRGLNQAKANAEDGISLIQTAEGALNETHAILQRMRELAVQASNGTYQNEVDRANINKEMESLKTEIDRIASSTHFNKIQLLDGSSSATATASGTFGTTTINVSATKDQADALTLGVDKDADAENLAVTIGDDGKVTVKIGTKDTGTGSFKITAEDINRAIREQADKLIKEAAKNPEDTVKAAAAQGAAIARNTTVSFNGDITIANNTESATLADTKFQTTDSGADGTLVFQIGANGLADQKVSLGIGDMSSVGIGVSGVSAATQDNASAAIAVIDEAINRVSGTRADLGALQNRLEHTSTNLATTSENLTAAESRIRDVDMAKEMMEMTKNNILAQAAQAMLAQANTQPQNVLQLLQ